jgi:hypothetical protein
MTRFTSSSGRLVSTRVPNPPRPWLRPEHILATADVRRLCGKPGPPVDRHTLLRWRASRGFPAPVRVIRQAKGQALELWDRRDVVAWLKANPPVQ